MALGYLQEAWAEARLDGIDGDCLAQASLFLTLAEFVGTYGEDAAAEYANGLAARIREVGPGSTIMATDFGQPDSPYPADGLESYIAGMLANGLSEDEVRQMVSTHARGLLDI